MKYKKLFALPVLAIGLLVLCASANAQNSDQGNNDQGNNDQGNDHKLGPYKLLATVNPPGGLGGFDISWVDSETGRYYLAARDTATPQNTHITVIDTERLRFLDNIPIPQGPTPGQVRANGIVVFHRNGGEDDEGGLGTLAAGTTPVSPDPSLVTFFDLSHPHAPPFSVSTGGNHRADELAYDPVHQIILVANDQDTPFPFITFISTQNPPHVLGKIVYDGTSGNPQSTGGIEQPVWNGRTNKFYLAIPSTVAHTNGEVDEIDPIKMKITQVSATTCGPAGLVRIPGQRLMTSCGDVLDIALIAAGKPAVVHTVAGVGADEIWFNSGDERVYFGRTALYVVNGLPPYNLIGQLPVLAGSPNPPFPLAPNQTTHSIAADSENNRIFAPFTNLGVLVFTDDLDSSEGHDN